MFAGTYVCHPKMVIHSIAKFDSCFDIVVPLAIVHNFHK